MEKKELHLPFTQLSPENQLIVKKNDFGFALRPKNLDSVDNHHVWFKQESCLRMSANDPNKPIMGRELSIGFWAFIKNPSEKAPLIEIHQFEEITTTTTSNHGRSTHISVSDNELNFTVFDAPEELREKTVIKTMCWQYFLLRIAKKGESETEFSFYINGENSFKKNINSTRNGDYKDIQISIGNTLIEGDVYEGTEPHWTNFQGGMADLRIYDYALSEESIKQLPFEYGKAKQTLIQAKNTKVFKGDFVYTAMVEHQGTVVGFALNEDRRFIYSVLNLDPAQDLIDREAWTVKQELGFPREIGQAGFAIVDNHKLALVNDKKEELTAEAVENGVKGDAFYSTTACFTGLTPFQVLSDGKYVYLFRQADKSEAPASLQKIADKTLLADRFVLSGTKLVNAREIRYKHSGNKIRPADRRDALSPVDRDKNHFIEPTLELAFVKNMNNGAFSVFQIPVKKKDEKRWQIFSNDTEGGTQEILKAWNFKVSEDGWFDFGESQKFVDDFTEKYDLSKEDIERIRSEKDEERYNAFVGTLNSKENIFTKNEELILNNDVEVLKKNLLIAEPEQQANPQKANGWFDLGQSQLVVDNFIKEHQLSPENVEAIVKVENDNLHFLLEGIQNDTAFAQLNEAEKVNAVKRFKFHWAVVESQQEKIDAAKMQVEKYKEKYSLSKNEIADFKNQTVDECVTDIKNKIISNKKRDKNEEEYKKTKSDLAEFFYHNRVINSNSGLPEMIIPVSKQAAIKSIDALSAILFNHGKKLYGHERSVMLAYVFNDNWLWSIRIPLEDSGRINDLLIPKYDDLGKVIENDGLHIFDQKGIVSEEIVKMSPVEIEDGLPWAISNLRIEDYIYRYNDQGEETREIIEAKVRPYLFCDAQGRLGIYFKGASTKQMLFNQTGGNFAVLYFENPDGVIRTKSAKLLYNKLGLSDIKNPKGLEKGPYNIYLARAAKSERPTSDYDGGLVLFLDTHDKADKIVKSHDYWEAKQNFYPVFNSGSFIADVLNGKRSFLLGNIKDIKISSEYSLYWSVSILLANDCSLLSRHDLKDNGEVDYERISNNDDFKKAFYRGICDFQIGEARFSFGREHELAFEINVESQCIEIFSIYLETINDIPVTDDIFSIETDLGKAYNAWLKKADSGSTSVDAILDGRIDTFNSSPGECLVEVSGTREYFLPAGYPSQTSFFIVKERIELGEQWVLPSPGKAILFSHQQKKGILQIDRENKENLESLRPSKKGLSLEAWIKPTPLANGEIASIIHYHSPENDAEQLPVEYYDLNIQEKDGMYTCFANIDNHRVEAIGQHPFYEWRHLAVTYNKFWGVKLNGGRINCGRNKSLSSDGEFSIELLLEVKQMSASEATILEKQGEYTVKIKKVGSDEFEVIYTLGNSDNLVNNTVKGKIGDFQKITLIKSKKKPNKESFGKTMPIPENDDSKNNGRNREKYAEKDTDELLKNMDESIEKLYEKLDSFDTSEISGVANNGEAYQEGDNYFISLIIEDNAYVSEEAIEILPPANQFKELFIGSSGFSGIVDEVRLWNRALTESEASRYQMPQDTKGLAAAWLMEEGEGKYLSELRGDNDAIIEGKVIWSHSPNTEKKPIRFYFDGEIQQVKLSTVDDSQKTNMQFSLGGYYNQGKYYELYQGEMEEVRIWGICRTEEEICDNVFSRLKGEKKDILANYTFDGDEGTEKLFLDAGYNGNHLAIKEPESASGPSGATRIKVVNSTAPVSEEIPVVLSSNNFKDNQFNDYIDSRPAIVEYGDVQHSNEGLINGILKKCYSFIKDKEWHLVTGFKVGNLISEWYGQAQYAPQIVGYMEGPPPIPGENLSYAADKDLDIYAYLLENSTEFEEADEIAYNYSVSKENGYRAAAEGETKIGGGIDTIIAPLGIGITIKGKAGVKGTSNWENTGNRSASFEKGVSKNTNRSMSASLAGYSGKRIEGDDNLYYGLGNTGYALVKSKTADVYVLKLAHNNAVVKIIYQPNPDIPEDTNIIPFPINPFYVKQGVLDGKFKGQPEKDHYPNADTYGQYSYFKPTEAYKLKKRIEREQLQLEQYYNSFDVEDSDDGFKAISIATGILQIMNAVPVVGPLIAGVKNQILGQIMNRTSYNNTDLRNKIAKNLSKRNIANTYVWTVEGGFYAESTETLETQQEVISNEMSINMGGGLGAFAEVEAPLEIEEEFTFGSDSTLTLTKSKTKESNNSFSLNISISLPTSPRYQFIGTVLKENLLTPGTVDAYRFMSFYLEPDADNYRTLFEKVIDRTWLAESNHPNAKALRSVINGVNGQELKCWRIMHRVTYVSRVLPKIPTAGDTPLEEKMIAQNIESNYVLIKLLEPYIKGYTSSEDFKKRVGDAIDQHLQEFSEKKYKKEILHYLCLYYGVDVE
ncbi:LamG-like jellyroll fold domain-containing protein [Lewinella cohaerens]|uniref:LamG-like jellyroll fold domain-containing protein n=1 Tax=Lewinella cohaerens TaxID=70995 RepID=UPI00036B8BE6|nr:LamG-like jellyroll fold domain-containing protein [Lewinella cohaerens]